MYWSIWEAGNFLILCKCCSAIVKISLCYLCGFLNHQHKFQNTAPCWVLWRKLTLLQPNQHTKLTCQFLIKQHKTSSKCGVPSWPWSTPAHAFLPELKIYSVWRASFGRERGLWSPLSDSEVKNLATPSAWKLCREVGSSAVPLPLWKWIVNEGKKYQFSGTAKKKQLLLELSLWKKNCFL